MMKKISILFFTVLMLGACQSANNAKERSDETSSVETVQDDSSSVKAKEQEEREKKSRFIEEAFSTLLNYDNSTYDERNSKINNYFSTEALEGLIGYEHLDDSANYVSKIEISDYYQNVGDENSFVIVADTSFKVYENEPTQLTNIYEITLAEKDGKYLIDSVATTPKQQQTMIP